ncbi:MAG: rod shape-determining protein MreC, partial [Actinomycetota bacterium]|nr:rod shape-determining protein MreC [Actinomycetota bacterium]
RSDGTGIGTTMRDGAQTLFTPLQNVASGVTRPVVGFIDAISDIASLREENEALRAENAQLQGQVQQFDSIQAELDHLRELNDLTVPDDLPTVVARIVSAGSSTFDLVRYIDKGFDDGISIGDAVIDEQGLIGRVDIVFDGRARVRLIIDPNVRVSVRDELTSETGIVTGANEKNLTLRMFDADVARAGSIIVTAGSRFPPGIVVGTVVETAADDAGFGLVAEVAPVVELSRLDFVKVIVGYSPLDAEIEDEPAPATRDDAPATPGSTTLPDEAATEETQ